MDNSLESVISRIKTTFTKGELPKYLAENPKPDKQRLMEYLRGIEAGKCPDNSSEDCRIKAHALMILLELTD